MSQPPRPENNATNQNQVQVVLKAQSIKILRGLIQVLEGVVVKLEAEPSAQTPGWLDKLLTLGSAVLTKIRSLLPENLSQKLSDPALTGIVAGIAVVLVWTTSAVLSAKPTEVAIPPSEVLPTPSITTPDVVPTPSITTPPQLTAPAAPEPVEIVPSPEVEPPTPAVVELTPEQALIAAIENQVAEISDRTAEGLIQSIQANFEGSRLTIQVSPDWYNLKSSQQDKLAAQMLAQANELDFTQLEIIDPQATLLARSPVVGKNMVILKRVEILG